MSLTPSPLYSGERAGVRGFERRSVGSAALRRGAAQRIQRILLSHRVIEGRVPHPNPLPRVQGKGNRVKTKPPRRFISGGAGRGERFGSGPGPNLLVVV